MAGKRGTAGKLLWALFAVPFKLASIGLMVGLPILGVWVASSLAVFFNRDVTWAIAAGLLMFPVLPLAWEVFAGWRRKRKRKTEPRLLNGLDRMILRTVFLNALFIGGLLAANPQAGFTALSARGDWMLAGKTGPRVDPIRRGLFQTADTLEWLYKLSKDNPYKKYDRDGDQTPTPKPTPRPTPEPTTPDQPDSDTTPPAAPTTWPQPPVLHPLVAQFPSQEEKSPQWVGRYIAGRIADPLERARAIHDYVANRVAYDVAALRALSGGASPGVRSEARETGVAAGDYPPQDAQTVFRTGKGVCAGYAKLFEAICQAADLEATYVVGDVRSEDGDIDGVGHAWNAVKIEERWYLVDVTWDSGFVNGERFTRQLRTVYFLTPPEVFSSDHFPEEAAWQLRERPLSRGEFIRQPMMQPSFYAEGLKLRSPDRSQVSVTDRVSIELENPRSLFLMAHYAPRGGGGDRECTVSSARTSITCAFPGAGSFDLKLYLAHQQYGRYLYVGKVLVNASGG